MLLSQTDFYNQIAENAYSFVKKNYNWEQTTSILDKLLTK
jgi:hypothetical protein